MIRQQNLFFCIVFIFKIIPDILKSPTPLNKILRLKNAMFVIVLLWQFLHFDFKNKCNKTDQNRIQTCLNILNKIAFHIYTLFITNPPNYKIIRSKYRKISTIIQFSYNIKYVIGLCASLNLCICSTMLRL